jgi:FkbM family methyltransferase
MIDQLLRLPHGAIKVADIGAGFFGRPALYQPLLDKGLAEVFAFEPDEREIDNLQRYLGGRAKVICAAVGDGESHTFYVGGRGLGMSSFLEPDMRALSFFNQFPEFGRVEATITLPTRRLDDIRDLPQLDFLKIDVQGFELTIFRNGREKLSSCVAVQTEISFITLYKNQPTFGEVDLELRAQGLIPHRFTDVKQWSIAPTVRNNDPRLPYHQLLEADIVYIRDIVHAGNMSDDQLAKLAAIAHFVYGSPDLAVRCILELENRKVCGRDAVSRYLQNTRI